MGDELDVDVTAAMVLVRHQRRDSSGCHCGWAELGASYAEHVVVQLRESGVLADSAPDGLVLNAVDEQAIKRVLEYVSLGKTHARQDLLVRYPDATARRALGSIHEVEIQRERARRLREHVDG